MRAAAHAAGVSLDRRRTMTAAIELHAVAYPGLFATTA
jgi:hypothetical protein